MKQEAFGKRLVALSDRLAGNIGCSNDPPSVGGVVTGKMGCINKSDARWLAFTCV